MTTATSSKELRGAIAERTISEATCALVRLKRGKRIIRGKTWLGDFGLIFFGAVNDRTKCDSSNPSFDVSVLLKIATRTAAAS